MNINYLRIFKAVCDEGGVTKASKKLYIAQPSVSLAIKELEKNYEVKLFDRISRKLILTAKGQQLYDYVTDILPLIDEIDEKLKEGDQVGGRLRIGSSVTFGNYYLIDLVSALKKEYPQLEFQLTIDSSYAIEELVANNGVDLGIIEGHSHLENIHSRIILDDDLVYVKSRDFERKIETYDDLNNCEVLLRNLGSAHREIFDGLMKAHDINPKIVMESISTSALIEGCIHGLGLAFLPHKFIEDYLENGLVTISALPVVKRNYFLITHQNKYVSNNMEIFIRQLEKIR